MLWKLYTFTTDWRPQITNTHKETHILLTLFPFSEEPEIAVGIWRIQQFSYWVTIVCVCRLLLQLTVLIQPSWTDFIRGYNWPQCVNSNKKHFSQESFQLFNVQKASWSVVWGPIWSDVSNCRLWQDVGKKRLKKCSEALRDVESHAVVNQVRFPSLLMWLITCRL